MDIELTPAARRLLQSVADGHVDLVGCAFLGPAGGHKQEVTARMHRLEKLGLIDRHAAPMYRGKPLEPGSDHFADYHVVALTDLGRTALGLADPVALYPQFSTCRWCRRVIRRETADAQWARSQLAGFSPDPECPAAPNPEDGPMPGHEPGTAIVSPPPEEPVERVDPATLPKPVIPNIPRILFAA